MQMLLLVSLSLLWAAMLMNLALTLRILRWIRSTNETRIVQRQSGDEERHPLVIGAPAPEFKARTLAGQSVRLDDYAGHSIVLLLVSPACGHCRMEMPMLIKLAPLARKNANVEFVLVSDWGPIVTQQWLDRMRTEDSVDVTVPVLVAPTGKSDFWDDYNPRSLTPSFCLLDPQGSIQAAGGIPSLEWNKLKRTWEGVTRLSPLGFSGRS